MKKTYLLIIFLFILALLFIIISLVISSGKKETILEAPSPTPFINNTILPTNTNTAVPNSIPTVIPSDYPPNTATISALIENLPHQGTYFSLSYNFTDDSFFLSLNAANQAQGEMEFENFLKQNGVLDKDWLQNLTTNYQ
ncbi:MAG: hypothetical protein ABSE17_04090 [Candidatus Levyibacteriota bacterium]